MTSSSLVAGALLLAACSGRRGPETREREPRVATGPSRSAEAPPGEAEDVAPAPVGDVSPAGVGDVSPAAAMAASAAALLEAAGDARDRFAFPFESDAREDWHYVPRSRRGLAIGDMSDGQRRAFWALVDAGLSRSGRSKVEGILTIEPILGRLEGNAGFRDPARYHVALFGRPGGREPWGWRFEGHHLSIHFTVGAGIATTPAFLGANPARVPDGAHGGLRVLGVEEDLGRALFVSLDPGQRRRAILSASAPADIVTEASRRVRLDRFEGLPAADMTDAQRAALLHLVQVYAQNFRPELAGAHMDRIRGAGIERLRFAWAGRDQPGQSHYYRIHGPTHLIEYDNRGGNHIHTVFRDLEQDFGDGLLARHLREDHGEAKGGRGGAP